MLSTVYSACFSFFFNDTATTEIYTLSLHDALPIFEDLRVARHRLREEHAALDVGAKLADHGGEVAVVGLLLEDHERADDVDRKSTRLNSSHANISYAVFCLTKKRRHRRPRRVRRSR